MLTRFWFQLQPFAEATPLNLGCGVTAESEEAALSMVRTRVFAGAPFEVEHTIADVDLATLDQGHIIPNMGNPIVRGVWFPLGYA